MIRNEEGKELLEVKIVLTLADASLLGSILDEIRYSDKRPMEYKKVTAIASDSIFRAFCDRRVELDSKL